MRARPFAPALAFVTVWLPYTCASAQGTRDSPGAPQQTGPASVADDTPPETVPLEIDPAQGAAEASGAGAPDRARMDRVAVTFGASVVGQYISRGVAFSEARSYQPYVTMRVALPELTGGAITDASVFAGNWNSLQSGGPGLGQPATGGTPGWYEADLYAGAAVEIGGRLAVSATYFRYLSPANSFPEYNDFDLTLRYDDGGLWGDGAAARGFRLQPALRVVQEGGQPNRPDALYVQPSLTPTMRLGPEDGGVTVSLPMAIGLSDSFYRGVEGGRPTFGFFRVGAGIAANPFGGAARDIRLTAGVDCWMLNDDVANGLNDDEWVGRIGFVAGF